MILSVLFPKCVFKGTFTGRRNKNAGRVVVCFGLAFSFLQFCYPSLELLECYCPQDDPCICYKFSCQSRQ